MSKFEKKYEIVKSGPEAMDWDVYESETLTELKIRYFRQFGRDGKEFSMQFDKVYWHQPWYYKSIFGFALTLFEGI